MRNIPSLLIYKAIKALERKIIDALLKNGSFSAYDIVPGEKTIRLGFYSLKAFFLTPKDNFLLWILWKLYGYKFTETTVSFFTGPDLKLLSKLDATQKQEYFEGILNRT